MKSHESVGAHYQGNFDRKGDLYTLIHSASRQISHANAQMKSAAESVAHLREVHQ